MQKTHLLTRISGRLIDNNIKPGDLILDNHYKKVFIVLATGHYDIILTSRPVWCLTGKNIITRLFAD